MSKLKKYQISQFAFVGKLQKIATKKGKIKYLKLATEDGKHWIKVPKKIRVNLDSNIAKGSQLEIAGTQKRYLKTGKSKFTATTVILIPSTNSEPEIKVKEQEISLLPIFNTTKKAKAKVLVCQKSNCWNKGGKEVYAELKAILSDRNLDSQIPLKKTGCLGKCKKAPNIVMLPDKARYSKVKPKQISNLVEKHLLV